MEYNDYKLFAGAPDGAWICESEVAVYIMHDNKLSVFTDEGENTYELRLHSYVTNG
jgi:hypothetical protein